MSEATQASNADRLIGRIEAEAVAECEAILGEARAQAEALREKARAQARARLREEIAGLRRSGTQAVRTMDAKAETERRQSRQRRGLAAQERGLAWLCAKLDALWQQPQARETWVARVLEEAAAHMLPGLWSVAHPEGWAVGERADFAEKVAAVAGEAPVFEVEAGVRSGLMIRSDTARIDATGPGICRDSTRLRALFQAKLEAMEGERGR